MQQKNTIKESLGSRIFDVINVIFFALVILAMLIPVMKVVSDSFDSATSYSINLIPKKFSVDAYTFIARSTGLYIPFINSITTTIAGTVIGLTVCTIGAYVLTQRDMPGRKYMVAFVMFTMIFNGGLVPTYLVFRSLRLINTFWAVLLPLSLNVYNMILMKNFFEQIPESLMESANIDGCTPFQTFYRIVLPLSKPALASIGLFFAVAFWNEFFHFVMYITDIKKYNFQVKIRELVLDSQQLTGAEYTVSIKQMQNAVIVVAIIPWMIIYPFCQKFFVQGITMGAVKE